MVGVQQRWLDDTIWLGEVCVGNGGTQLWLAQWWSDDGELIFGGNMLRGKHTKCVCKNDGEWKEEKKKNFI